MHRSIRFIMCCATLLVNLGMSGPARADDNALRFDVVPEGSRKVAVDSGYYVVHADRGEVTSANLSVVNRSSRPINVGLAAVDAVTGPTGGVSYGLPSEKIVRTGAWIRLDRTRLTLPAGATRDVSFDVTVPTDAPVGQSVAGVAVFELDSSAGNRAAESGDFGAVVNVETRRVVAVEIDVPGPAVPKLSITGVSPLARSDALYAGIGIRHDGTAFTQGRGIIAIEGGFEGKFAFGTFVPGTSIDLPVKWRQQVADGEYDAEVSIRYGSRRAEWQGTIVVGDEILKDYEDRGGAVERRLPTKLIWVGGLVLILTLIAILRYFNVISLHRPHRTTGATPVTVPELHRPVATAVPRSSGAILAPPSPARRRVPPPPPPPPIDRTRNN